MEAQAPGHGDRHRPNWRAAAKSESGQTRAANSLRPLGYALLARRGLIVTALNLRTLGMS